MDPNNHVVKLCAEGMRAEGDGRMEDARALFAEAWGACTDDFEACIAAHYVARHQQSPEETLHWNVTSLEHANRVADESVRGFYPSLYLNIGHSHEQLGNPDEAARYFDLARSCASDVPDGRYGTIVRNAIADGQRRVRDAASKA
ncbi:MAG TPA: hypothetical protein VHI13_09135 [Candidatus Kapabacteria bacterium]|nr:hypothetical protein [Candidatus Kapabacteria bacterium]